MTPRGEFQKELLKAKGVYEPCPGCAGLGAYYYSSTATWRGGVGGQSFTMDICDKCWGSGNAHETWTDIRKLEERRRDWEKEQVLKYLGNYFMVGFDRVRPYIKRLADLCEKESRRRKIPESEHPFWWAHHWELQARLLNRLAADKETRESTECSNAT